jgi:peptidoglycan/xylan/chitin deacetylase (PgdA/CDA1 family)
VKNKKYYGIIMQRWLLVVISVFIGTLILPYSVLAYPTGTAFVSDCENVADWSSWGGEMHVADTVHYVQGTQGIKFTSINTVQTLANRNISLDATDKQFEASVYIDDVANLDYLRIQFTSAGGHFTDYFTYDIFYTGYLHSGWNTLVINRANCSIVAGAPSWTTITDARFIIGSKAATTVNVTLDNFVIIPSVYTGKVTFRFDDGLTSAYTVAKPILDIYGYAGVSSVITHNIGLTNYMNVTQLTALQNAGWDIVSHGDHHYQMDSISTANATAEMVNSRNILINNGFAKGARYYVPPYGQWVVHDTLAKTYYDGQFITRPSYDNVLVSDTYRNGSILEITDATSLATIKGYIDNVKTYRAWVTFLIHGVTPAVAILLDDTVDYINAQGVDVVTFSDIFAPSSPTSFTVINHGEHQLNLSWTKGLGSDNTLVRYKLGSYPTSITDGTLLYNGSSSSTTMSGLTEGEIYYIGIWGENSMDSISQYSSRTNGSGLGGLVFKGDFIIENVLGITMLIGTLVLMFVVIVNMQDNPIIAQMIILLLIAIIGTIGFVIIKGMMNI